MSKIVRDWLESILLAGVIVAILFVVFWPFIVSGSSMEPSFSNRDRIAVSRIMVWLGKYGRGDAVVCKHKHGGESEYIVKRIIGVPGDLLEIRDGKVYINKVQLSEEYILHNYTSGELEIEIAQDEYFLLGDNRDISSDSRYEGPVKARNVIGRVVIRWYPFDRITVY